MEDFDVSGYRIKILCDRKKKKLDRQGMDDARQRKDNHQ